MAAGLSEAERYRLKREVFEASMVGKADEIRDILSSLQPEQVKDIIHHFSPDRGMAPLHGAALLGNLDVVRLLIEEFSAEMDQKCVVEDLNISGTALMFATVYSHMDVVKYLVGKGCDVNLADSDGAIPLLRALELDRIEVAKYLMEHGAHVNTPTNEGTTCLMVACYSQDGDIVEYLLERGANPNVIASSKTSALYFAAAANNYRAVRHLLNHGATMSKDEDGETPLTVAAIYMAAQTVEVFLEVQSITRQEKIDALELLGATTAKVDLDAAFGYLRDAMVERYKDPSDVIRKPHSLLPTLDGVVESRNLEELQTRRMDEDTFRLECLAIIDRLLGPNSPRSHKEYDLFGQSLLDNGRYELVTPLWIHVVKSSKCPTENFIGRAEFFLETFEMMLQDGLSPTLEQAESVAKLIMERVQQDPTNIQCNDDLVRMCLKCVLLGLTVAKDQESRQGLQTVGEDMVRFNPPLSHGSSSLHLAVEIVREQAPLLEEEAFNLSHNQLVPFLIECGADVNAMSDDGDRPLHVITDDCNSDDASEIICSVTRALAEAGALVGVLNRAGQTPLSRVVMEPVADTLRQYLPPPLQSLAASAVIQHKLPYEASVPDVVAKFVHLHATGRN